MCSEFAERLRPHTLLIGCDVRLIWLRVQCEHVTYQPKTKGMML